MRKNIENNYMTVIKNPIIRFQHKYLNRKRNNNQKDFLMNALVDLHTDKIIIREDWNKQIYRKEIPNIKFRTLTEVSDEHTESLTIL